MEAYRMTYYRTLAEQTKKNLEARNFTVHTFDTLKEAHDSALQMIDKDKTVGFAGSKTLDDSGLVKSLLERNQLVFDRKNVKNDEEKTLMMKKTLTADYFLTGINGISKNGELVNIDWRGNRVAAMTYGPDKVFAFVGINKVYDDLEHTIKTVRNHAAPLNVQKIEDLKTPCNYTGSCADCVSEDCICSTITIHRRSYIKERFHVFLVLEELGF